MEMPYTIPKHVKYVLGGCFLNCLFSFAFPLMSLVITSGNKEFITILPWMMSGAYLISAVFQPKLGSLLDRGSTSAVIKLAAFLACSGMLGLFLLESHLVFIIISLGLIVLGLSIISLVGSKTVEGQVSSELRGKTSLLFSGLGNLGFGFSALLAYFFLSEHKGLLLLLDGISTLIYAAILIKSEQPSVLVSNGSEKVPQYHSISLSMAQLAILIGILCYFIPIVASFSIVPLQYQIQNIDFEHLTPVMFGVNNLVVFFTSIVILNRINRISSLALTISSALLLSIGLSLVPIVNNQIQNVFVTAIWSVGEVLAYPVIAKVVFESFPAGQEGKAAGYKLAMLRLAFVLGPIFVGLVQWSGSGLFPFIFGIIPILGLLILCSRYFISKSQIPVVNEI